MKKDKKKTFEDAITRLDEIVQELESDETTLASSLELYSEGVDLLEECIKSLHKTELQLQELKKRNDGLFELVDLSE